MIKLVNSYWSSHLPSRFVFKKSPGEVRTLNYTHRGAMIDLMFLKFRIVLFIEGQEK